MLVLLVDVLVYQIFEKAQGNDDLGSARHLRIVSAFEHRKIELKAGSCQCVKASLTPGREWTLKYSHMRMLVPSRSLQGVGNFVS